MFYVTIIPRTTVVVLMEYKDVQLNFRKVNSFFHSLLETRRLYASHVILHQFILPIWLSIYLLFYINMYIYTCKDAIQCRQTLGGQPPLSYTSSQPISNIFTFLELGEIIIDGQTFFFEFRKLKTHFQAKKQKLADMRRGSTFYARLF